MRKVIDLQMEFWKKDIANIEFDLESRDEIPKLLMGPKTGSAEKELRKRQTRHGSMEDTGFRHLAFKLQLGF
jgi:hypothetical protein